MLTLVLIFGEKDHPPLTDELAPEEGRLGGLAMSSGGEGLLSLYHAFRGDCSWTFGYFVGSFSLPLLLHLRSTLAAPQQVSEVQAVIIKAGSMAAGRQTWCWTRS